MPWSGPQSIASYRMAGMTPTIRTVLALLLFTGWLALLFVGYAAGGAVHLLLAGALGVFPWKALIRT